MTTTGVPRPADAAQAAQACGLAVPKRRITRAAQIPGLVEAWDLALAAELLELTDTEAAAGPNYDAWPNGADEDVLSVWLAAFVVGTGLDALDDEVPADRGQLGSALVVVAVLESLACGAQSAKDVGTAVKTAMTQDPTAAIAFVQASFDGDPVERAIERLKQWGAVEHTAGRVALTALGGYVCRALDLDPGEQVDPAVDAVSLLAALEAEPQRGPRAASAWLGSRTARAAADQLLLAAAIASPIGRVMAVTIVQELGEEALPAWKKAAKAAGIGPYARMALWEEGLGPEPSPADGAWLAADLAVTIQTLGPDVETSAGASNPFADDVLEDLDPHERAELVELIQRSGHPAADTALAMLHTGLADDGDEAGGEDEDEGGRGTTRGRLAAKKSAKAPAARDDVGYQLKIRLRGLRPPVWRRVVVPDVTLRTLHEIVQQAMGWENYHMHAFEARGARYGHPDRELGLRDEGRARLSSLMSRPGDKLGYEYDFGDGWEHEIVLEKLVAPVDRPTCTAGKRHCPPEDCGGVWGYADLIDALADPKHERHDELIEWMGETHGEPDFDPERFDLAAADRSVSAVRL